MFKKTFTLMAVAASLAVTGATPMMAQDYDMGHDRRDLRHDYSRVARMRADIARDQERLNRDIRWGNRYRIEADERDLARDQARLDAQLRDIHHDQRDLRHDYYERGYR